MPVERLSADWLQAEGLRQEERWAQAGQNREMTPSGEVNQTGAWSRRTSHIDVAIFQLRKADEPRPVLPSAAQNLIETQVVVSEYPEARGMGRPHFLKGVTRP